MLALIGAIRVLFSSRKLLFTVTSIQQVIAIKGFTSSMSFRHSDISFAGAVRQALWGSQMGVVFSLIALELNWQGCRKLLFILAASVNTGQLYLDRSGH